MIETVMVYKFPMLSREEIENMFSLSELKQTLVYQDAQEEGRQEGRRKEALAIMLRLLSRRLGSLDSMVVKQIQELSLTQLEALEDRLLEFSKVSDLEDWMQNHA